MEMQELEITIDKDGKVKVAVHGIHGEDCLAITKNLENAVGMVENRTYTAEYYEPPVEVLKEQTPVRATRYPRG
jgi:hypothetical protein